jgi:hypothetical protein
MRLHATQLCAANESYVKLASRPWKRSMASDLRLCSLEAHPGGTLPVMPFLERRANYIKRPGRCYFERPFDAAQPRIIVCMATPGSLK